MSSWPSSIVDRPSRPVAALNDPRGPRPVAALYDLLRPRSVSFRLLIAVAMRTWCSRLHLLPSSSCGGCRRRVSVTGVQNGSNTIADGVLLEKYLTTEPLQSQPGSVTLLTLIGTLQTGP